MEDEPYWKLPLDLIDNHWPILAVDIVDCRKPPLIAAGDVSLRSTPPTSTQSSITDIILRSLLSIRLNRLRLVNASKTPNSNYNDPNAQYIQCIFVVGRSRASISARSQTQASDQVAELIPLVKKLKILNKHPDISINPVILVSSVPILTNSLPLSNRLHFNCVVDGLDDSIIHADSKVYSQDTDAANIVASDLSGSFEHLDKQLIIRMALKVSDLCQKTILPKLLQAEESLLESELNILPRIKGMIKKAWLLRCKGNYAASIKCFKLCLECALKPVLVPALIDGTAPVDLKNTVSRAILELCLTVISCEISSNDGDRVREAADILENNLNTILERTDHNELAQILMSRIRAQFGLMLDRFLDGYPFSKSFHPGLYLV